MGDKEAQGFRLTVPHFSRCGSGGGGGQFINARTPMSQRKRSSSDVLFDKDDDSEDDVLLLDAQRRPAVVGHLRVADSLAEARLFEALAPLPVREARHIRVPVSLFGAVAVGPVLNDLGFHDVVSIEFAPGGITRLLGVPETLAELRCADNHLDADALRDLWPCTGMRTLIVPGNKIAGEVAGLGRLRSLELLDLENNAVRAVVPGGDRDGDQDALPPSLLTLRLAHNQLAGDLDLSGCPGLRTLDVRFNPVGLRVLGLPTTIDRANLLLPDGARAPAFLDAAANAALRPARMDDRATVIATVTGGGASTATTATTTTTDELAPMALPPGYEAAVEEYFSARREYERRERLRLHQVPPPPPVCVRCGRTGGGMLFSGRGQKYVAQCLADPPCDFRLAINRGRFAPLRAYAGELRERLLGARESIIRLQFDALLGHLPPAEVDARFRAQVARYNALFERHSEFERRANEAVFGGPARAARQADLRAETARLLSEVRTLLAQRDFVGAARVQSRDLRPVAAALGAETFPGRGVATFYEKAEGASAVVLPDVHTLDRAQYNVGVPL